MADRKKAHTGLKPDIKAPPGTPLNKTVSDQAAAPVPSKHFEPPAPVAPLPPAPVIQVGATVDELLQMRVQVAHEVAYLNYAGQAMAAMLPRAEHVTPEMITKIAATSWQVAGEMMAAKPEFNDTAE